MNDSHPYQWLTTGDAFYGALLADIGRARESIRLEMYIYMAGEPGDAIRAALHAAALRGVRVKILLDAFGSYELPSEYFAELSDAGGQVQFFNPLSLNRIAFRDHRKLLICDDHTALVSGFNISLHELGDGVTRGWRDLGLRLSGPVARNLATSFDSMFAIADFKHPLLARLPLRHRFRRALHRPHDLTILTSAPGMGSNLFKKTLLYDLKHAKTIRIISAYFLPSYRIRRALTWAARRRRDVKIITAGRTDVQMARFAGRALYARLLRAGIHISEYEAQILHTKLIIADNVVYIGSANLDTRSLSINYELLVRIEDNRLAHEARQIFNDHQQNSRNIDRRSWSRSRGVLEKLMERVSHFILARLDFLFARRQLGKLR
jgi:cardiolipin synthase A/B